MRGPLSANCCRRLQIRGEGGEFIVGQGAKERLQHYLRFAQTGAEIVMQRIERSEAGGRGYRQPGADFTGRIAEFTIQPPHRIGEDSQLVEKP